MGEPVRFGMVGGGRRATLFPPVTTGVEAWCAG
jgi:hypothetical protein